MPTRAAARIAKHLNLTGAVVYGTFLSGPGRAIRGWFVSEPAGGWRYLGGNLSDIVRARAV